MQFPFDILIHIISKCDIQTLRKFLKFIDPKIVENIFARHVQNLYKDERKTNMNKSGYVLKPYVSENYSKTTTALLYLCVDLPYDCEKFLHTFAEKDLLAPSYTEKLEMVNGCGIVCHSGDILSGYSIISKRPLLSMSLRIYGQEIHRRLFWKGTTNVKMSSFSGTTLPYIACYNSSVSLKIEYNVSDDDVSDDDVSDDDVSDDDCQVYVKYTLLQPADRRYLSTLDHTVPTKHFVYNNNKPELVTWRFKNGCLTKLVSR